MKNADMPAMPLFNNNGSPVHHSNAGMENHGVMAGLTKREMMAMAAMQGQLSALCTNDSASWFTDAMRERGISLGEPEKLIAINAVNYADALLAELDRTSIAQHG